MKIADVVCSVGRTGYFYDDLQAIRRGAVRDGFNYAGSPVTAGFRKIRQPGEAVSVMLVLEDGQVALGDCVAVQYSGAGGREPLFLAENSLPVIERVIAPLLRGRELGSFRELAGEIDTLALRGRRLHPALRYGITQALLDAVAKARRITMAEVIRDEYRIAQEMKRVPILGQSGDERFANTDKMILKGVDALPHGLVNNVAEKLGSRGEILKEYVGWVRDRIILLRENETYSPVIHIDTYGTVGLAFDSNVERIANYFGELALEAMPFRLRIEGPLDMENRAAQLQVYKELRRMLKAKRIAVEIVADEWCNTWEDIKQFVDEEAADMIHIKPPDLGGVNNLAKAILYCKKKGIGAYCGGTCNGTDRSAAVCTNIALACGADLCMAKPGMGFDEGYMIVHNEMNRVLALVNARNRVKILI
ncbi:MAG: methylaspartate ammonia-lyase [Peptococcaceae bacterium]|jgi:methylaspartate ammonia-lyase|nr:methylaspartate ammonia-lyase [Peptococcaceae bacterium]MDH7525030.1 methylaspartate ammonia-lyase [Peptococcaceae bacterium]